MYYLAVWVIRYIKVRGGTKTDGALGILKLELEKFWFCHGSR